MVPSTYQQEQLSALQMVRRHLAEAKSSLPENIAARLADYHDYRRRLDRFVVAHFQALCQPSCYENRLSACCSREGIVTFFADVVINVLASPAEVLNDMVARLSRPNPGFKCVYLGPHGCIWQVRPIVCALFLCDAVEQRVLTPYPDLMGHWQALRHEAQRFKWPDRPVLFDDLERLFIAAGLCSPLMYLNTSPGLLQVKRRAGIGALTKTGS